MIDALYCRSTAVLLAMHVWLYVVAVLYMVSDAGRPHGDYERLHERTGQSVLYLPVDLSMRAECMHEK